MKCEIIDRDQRIDDFLLAKLSPEDADAFEIHLFGCPECFEELRLREQMVKLIKEERVTVVEDYARQRSPQQSFGVIRSIAEFFRFRQNIWIYAGAVVVLLVGALLTQVFQKEVADEYAANFTEFSPLEGLVGQPQRSSIFSVTIISPRIGENFKDEIQFRYEIKQDGEPFSGPLDLKILDNKGSPVHSAKIERGQYILKQRLIPGLYYWTIENPKNQGEMLYLGEFFVNRPLK